MRTTVNLADDVVAGVEALQRERGIGRSEALNELARNGLVRPGREHRYTLKPRRMGMRVEVANVADVLDLLDDES